MTAAKKSSKKISPASPRRSGDQRRADMGHAIEPGRRLGKSTALSMIDKEYPVDGP